MNKNLLLKGGRVKDIAQNLDSIADVAIVDGKISAIGETLEGLAGAEVLDLPGRSFARASSTFTFTPMAGSPSPTQIVSESI